MLDVIYSYVLDNFFLLYGLNKENYEINYGFDDKSKIQIFKSIETFDDLSNIDLNNVQWVEWLGTKIPVLFGSNSSIEIITAKNDNVYINIDIIASAFFLLSSWQEKGSSVRDVYGRFSYTESIQYKLNITHIPVVNYYFSILKTGIEKAYFKPEIKIWGNHQFAICLTHDIDICKSDWLQCNLSKLKSGHIFSIFRLVFKKMLGSDIWFNFNSIFKIEKDFKAHSSFYFLPYKGKKRGITNADYKINNRQIKRIIKTIQAEGSEVGVHGSIGSHTDSELFNLEIKKISVPVSGNRFHYLMFDSVETPEILQNSHLKYDVTLGFAEHIGFRNSICSPFYLFDLKSNKPTTVFEIPLMVMDTTLAEKKYMHAQKNEALKKIKVLLDEVRTFNGCVSVLWHNNYFSEYKHAGWKDFYIEILKYGKEKNALLESGKNIINLFNN